MRLLQQLRAGAESCGLPQVVSPGDSIIALPDRGKVRVGAGLQADGGHLRSVRAGVVCQTKRGKLWVEGRQKRHATLLEH